MLYDVALITKNETTQPMNILRLKKREDKRIRSGHPWIYSNEINNTATPLKLFVPGAVVTVQANDDTLLGKAYINPHSLIAARMFSRDPHQELDLPFFIKRLSSALACRDSLYKRPFYRLVFSEADHLPGVVVDRFGDHLAVQINTAGMEQCKNTIIEALRHVLPDTKSILLRNDSPIRTQEGLSLYVEPAYGEPPETISVEENGVTFNAPFLSGQKTGWFYDHRDNRARLTKYVDNRSVLDVFSYLGGFGVQAAVCGAKHVDCIDSSLPACEAIKANAKLNKVDGKVAVICDDAFDAMKKLVQAGKVYDVVILDPPAFVKKSKDRQSGLIAYQRMIELGLKLLAKNGVLAACSCSMHVSMDDFTHLIMHAAAKTERSVQLLERGHQGLDHPIHPAIPETDYLKAVVVRRMDDA